MRCPGFDRRMPRLSRGLSVPGVSMVPGHLQARAGATALRQSQGFIRANTPQGGCTPTRAYPPSKRLGPSLASGRRNG